MSDKKLYALAQQVGEALKAHGLMLVTAESCTGGWIGEAVTMVPGSSDWFERGFVISPVATVGFADSEKSFDIPSKEGLVSCKNLGLGFFHGPPASHSHPIRGGLYYNLDLRWDGVPSLADAMRMLREQAQRTPPNQWVRVIGGWSEFQLIYLTNVHDRRTGGNRVSAGPFLGLMFGFLDVRCRRSI